MAGRKPKPTALKKLEGNPGKRKLNAKEPVPAKGMPDCPKWLLPEAKEEWKRLCQKLSDMGVLTEIDMAAFAAYCQASIVFDVARQMVEISPALLKRSKLMTATKRIVNYGNAGYYQVLSAEVGGKHGFSVSGLVFDEIHTQPNRQLYDVLTKGSSDARQNPLHFIITTAGTDRHSIAFELHTKAVDILEGRRVDPTFYPVVYGLKDDEDWEDETNWYKVNPSLGYTVDIERLRDAYREAKQNPADEVTFKWLRLNMWVNSTVAWIPDLDKSSFSNIEQQSLEFVKYTLDPWVVRWEQSIQRILLTPEEKKTYFVKFNVEGLLRGDYQSRMQGYSVGRQNGWMSANDIRELEDLDRIPAEDGGDLYLVNGNMLPLSQAGSFYERDSAEPQVSWEEDEQRSDRALRFTRETRDT